MPKPFEGRLALVTGASRGIGAAIAEALAREGAHVVLTARSTAELEQVEERIHQAGGAATIAGPLDLTEPDGIGKLAIAISGRWETLDFLVLNAALLGTLGPVASMTNPNVCVAPASLVASTKCGPSPLTVNGVE